MFQFPNKYEFRQLSLRYAQKSLLFEKLCTSAKVTVAHILLTLAHLYIAQIEPQMELCSLCCIISSHGNMMNDGKSDSLFLKILQRNSPSKDMYRLHQIVQKSANYCIKTNCITFHGLCLIKCSSVENSKVCTHQSSLLKSVDNQEILC